MKRRSSVAGNEGKGLCRPPHSPAVPSRLTSSSCVVLRMTLALAGIALTSACDSIDIVKLPPLPTQSSTPEISARIVGSASPLSVGEKRLFRIEVTTGEAFQTVSWTSSANLSLSSPVEGCGIACAEATGVRPGAGALGARGSTLVTRIDLRADIQLTVQ